MALNVEGVTFRQEKIKCGKAGCQKCPHGPYWYAYWHSGPKLKKKYVGKILPESVIQTCEQQPAAQQPLSQREKDFLQCEVLSEASFTVTRRRYRYIAVNLQKRIKEATSMDERGQLQDELAALRGAFKRLFPNRR